MTPSPAGVSCSVDGYPLTRDLPPAYEPPPRTNCYSVGTPIKGFCGTIQGEFSDSMIIGGCTAPTDPNPRCFNDWMHRDGSWAGAYKPRMGALLPGDAAFAETTLTESGGQWTISVAVNGTTKYVWEGDPVGFIERASVTSISCSPAGKSFACAV